MTRTLEERACAARRLPPGEEVDAVVTEVLNDYCLAKSKVRPFSTSIAAAYTALRWYMESLTGDTFLSMSRHFERVDGEDEIVLEFRVDLETSRPYWMSRETWNDAQWFNVYGEGETLQLAICRMILHLSAEDEPTVGPITTLSQLTNVQMSVGAMGEGWSAIVATLTEALTEAVTE